MNKSIYDSKIIILDIDFLEIGRYNLDDTIYTKRLLQELAANQNLVLITDSDFNYAYGILDSLGLKSGFLISNSGSSISNIANKKIIMETMMSREMGIVVASKCIWSSLNFSINTRATTYPYLMVNSWINKKYKADLSHLYNYAEGELRTIEDVRACINNNEIRSIEIYFLENDDETRKKNMREKIIEAIDFEDMGFAINSSILHVIPTVITKFKALEFLAQKMNWDLKNNGLYCGIGQCTTEICQNVYFSAVTKKSLYKKDHKPFGEGMCAEEIPRGTISWISWFYKNLHLWSGEEEKLKLAIPKNKMSNIDPESLEGFKNGTSKFLTFGLSKENNILTKSTFLRKLVSKKPECNGDENSFRIGFWKNQIPAVIKLIESK